MTLILKAKIVKYFEEHVCSELEFLSSRAMEGDLKGLEDRLSELLNGVYDEIVGDVIRSISTSAEFRVRLKKLAKDLGLRRLKKRKVKLQIGTGSKIEYESYYAYVKTAAEYKGSRHLSLVYWGCIAKASPKYYHLASLMSVMSPSFAIGQQLLDNQSIKANYNRIRSLSIQVGIEGRKLGPQGIVKPQETLAGKRVVIELDGGRSRIRLEKKERSAKGYALYDTPWQEPKLLVIQTLDDKGNIERKEALPFYAATMDNYDTCFKDLTAILKVLEAHKAKEIQVVADGARTIWKNIKQAIMNAGVKAKQLTFTLDYYHAVEHLSELVGFLNPTEKEKQAILKKWKECLWSGLCYSIRQDFKERLEQKKYELTEEMETALNYFKKHHDRMQYQKFRKRKWLCGSGLVESAVRRIINLRFKSAGSFWLTENLQQLIFLRATFLAKRWKLLIHNLANRNKLGWVQK